MTRVLIVGAGIVGLSTAYHLAAEGAQVTVLDRTGVAAGASWGNAGWVCPGLVAPLAEPGGWRHGVRAVTDPHAPLTLSRITPALAVFLARFTAQMTPRRFTAALSDTAALSREALAAFDRLAAAGVRSPLIRADYTVGAESPHAVEALAAEVAHIASLGIDVTAAPVDAAEVPYFSAQISAALTITGQAYIDPGAYLQDLARLATEAGVRIVTGAEVVAGRAGAAGIGLVDAAGRAYSADQLLIAAGAWSDEVIAAVLGRRLRTGQASGRGYSFTVSAEPAAMPTGPVYLPAERVVLTPYGDGLRVAGTMEFDRPDAPLRPARITAICHALDGLLTGIDLSSRRDAWVGPRPISADGRPIIRRLHPRAMVATGHGMWGVVLGPVTGERVAAELLAAA